MTYNVFGGTVNLLDLTGGAYTAIARQIHSWI